MRAGESHAEQLLEQAEGCPLCGGPVSNSTLKVVPMAPKEEAVQARAPSPESARTTQRTARSRAPRTQASLRGLCPEDIICAARAGFAWWIDQTGATPRL